jgi:SRSO17 transposase
LFTCLEGREIDLIIDETGDKKKGKPLPYFYLSSDEGWMLAR